MSVHFRPQIIEALQSLWVALPVKAPGEYSRDSEIDARERQMAILDAYCFALADCSPEAVRNTVDNLRSGKIKSASKEFCPKPPALGDLAREEQRRLDAINRPKSVGYQPVGHQFKNWQEIHRHRAEELAEKGFVCIQNISIDDWENGKKRRRWKPLTQWFWSISEVWSPQ